MTPWEKVNATLIAKSISELHFEEVFNPLKVGPHYRLDLSSGVSYEFEARLSQWNHLWVNEKSLRRFPEQKLSAGQFFLDCQTETGMSDLTLGNFIEELNNTLSADMVLLQELKISVSELGEMSGEEQQKFLGGHPKLLLNKGRVGWGLKDLEAYSPESKTSFQMRWILVDKALLTGSQIKSEKVNLEVPDSHIALPVHPWQWDSVISQQFRSEIETGSIIDLGIQGDFYSPQTSLRTLSNVTHPEKDDLKVPLSILNTSCIRGLPHSYLAVTPELSLRLEDLIQNDKFLKHSNVSVLIENAAWGVKHPVFHQIPHAPYRYHEQLGAVWRESTKQKIHSHETAILSAALLYQDKEGKTLFGAYVKKSKLSFEAWLTQYTRHVILPLLHLQTSYGIGLVSHGQNIVVKLKDGVPSGLILKDFHGDLRLSLQHKNLHRELLGQTAERLTYLPAEHLIHDLITGHFITVLRFMAGNLESANEMTEVSFYRVIAAEIKKYQTQNPSDCKAHDLLVPTFQRVLVNKVRFQIGYGDSSTRPVPMLGSELMNPLYRNLI